MSKNVPTVLLVLAVFFQFFFWTSSVHAQTPSITFFTRSPWPHPFNYPCNINTDNDNVPGYQPEFHPLRPYPGNPCDPLIPKKIPEAPSTPDKQFLTFKCAKSLNVSGYTTTKDVVNICGMNILPANPMSAPLDASGTSPLYLCSSGSTDICFVKKIVWQVAVDLSAARLPFSGETEDYIDDASKVSSYISWYLNGTVFQSEKLPLNGLDPYDSKRIGTYTGPLNKLYPKDDRDSIKLNMSTAGVNSDYHNYIVSCQKDIDFAYITNALTTLLNAIFGNIFDTAHIVYILLRDAVNNLDQIGKMGEALVQIAILPPTSYNQQGAREILLQSGLNILGNDASGISDLLALGHSILSRIGTVLEAFRLDLAESCTTSGTRWRLSQVSTNFQPWIRKYVPFSTLEDTTGEFTVSVIPSAQPTDLDGSILQIGLTIDSPSDSRLYFPHLRAAIALTEMANALHTPILTPTPGLSISDRQLVRQRVTQHQGIDDTTPIEREYSPSHQLIRNTEVIEGAPAPAALYTPTDPTCDITDTRTVKSDKLLGGTVNGTLTYYQLFRFTPQLAIGCGNCPGSGNCKDRPQDCQALENDVCDSGSGTSTCCYGTCPSRPPGNCYNNHTIPGYCDNATCNGSDATTCAALGSCCSWDQPSAHCPSWPNKELRSAARINPFVKSPFVEKVYDLMVTGPKSLLSRWLPKLPLTEASATTWTLKTGRDETIPAESQAAYTGSTNDLHTTIVTAGKGGHAAVYFPNLGSLADNILGLPTFENLNLQRMLRPKGFIGVPSDNVVNPGDINCNVNAPDANLACVNKANYVDIARRWTSSPDGTHAELCYNDVVARADAAGINPGLALLVWLNESDASNYEHKTPVEDFGQHVGQYNQTNNFDRQITGFFQDVEYIKARCSSYFPTYGFRSFAAIFLTGDSCIPNSADDAYAAMLQTEWSWLSSCPFPFP